MLPLEDGGVVDNKLKVLTLFSRRLLLSEDVGQVYKTTNIRVADLSIVPLHIGSHTQGGSSGHGALNESETHHTFAATAFTLGEIGMAGSW